MGVKGVGFVCTIKRRPHKISFRVHTVIWVYIKSYVKTMPDKIIYIGDTVVVYVMFNSH